MLSKEWDGQTLQVEWSADSARYEWAEHETAQMQRQDAKCDGRFHA